MLDWIRQRLVPAERSVPRALPVDHREARDIVSLCGGGCSDHQIMQQNVASYLAHLRTLQDSLPSQAFDDRASLKKAVTAGMSATGNQLEAGEKLRWRSKLQREIQSPYCDQQVGQRLQQCLEDLHGVLPEFAGIPHQVYLVGGPLAQREGRFGGNSDLDLVMRVESEDLPAASALVARLSPEQRLHTFELHVTGVQQWPAVESYFGAAEPLDESQLDQQVQSLVRRGLDSHDLRVDSDWRAHREQWAQPATLMTARPFPRALVCSLKG